MAEYTYNSLSKLFTATCDAIRDKSGTTDLIPHQDIPKRINELVANGDGVDTSAGTAVPDDILDGKIAYVKGEKITGTHICSSGGIDTSDATATTEDIADGKTAYVNGKKIMGTHACSTGANTSDATASSSDIIKGKTAYISSGKVTGTLEEASSPLTYNSGTVVYNEASGSTEAYFSIENTQKSKDVVLRAGTVVSQTVSKNNFGTATTDDVTKGITFTSENGLKLIGTHVCGSISDTTGTATASDIAEGQTAWVNGEQITGELEETSGTYSVGSGGTLSYFPATDLVKALFQVSKTHTGDILIRTGTKVTISIDGDTLGDATTDDVLEGVTFTSKNGKKLTGTYVPPTTTSGKQIVSGTVSGTNIIETGLSSIEMLFIYKTSYSSLGFVQGCYIATLGRTYYTACTNYSDYLKYCNTSNATDMSVSGGTFTWAKEMDSTYGFVTADTYTWYAVGA